ncbi:hypothetical protein BS47DRAFT_1366330 [Hydnum rufescens UP504]|uniref:Uncharacterized protein n=1 Tax=Hydnum rufescens UP504 TaxID=1448309 RepID=A0A9P6AL78_9AGAM|nr:hypothetical protein BS47DRAFT_1366330 [Hydnum rufescens UP504]
MVVNVPIPNTNDIPVVPPLSLSTQISLLSQVISELTAAIETMNLSLEMATPIPPSLSMINGAPVPDVIPPAEPNEEPMARPSIRPMAWCMMNSTNSVAIPSPALILPSSPQPNAGGIIGSQPAVLLMNLPMSQETMEASLGRHWYLVMKGLQTGVFHSWCI